MNQGEPRPREQAIRHSGSRLAAIPAGSNTWARGQAGAARTQGHLDTLLAMADDPDAGVPARVDPGVA